jgi:hypothetical protein
MSKYISQEDYANSVIGTMQDVDDAYGNQCVDLFKHFILKTEGFNCGTTCPDTGYAKDIWNCFERLSKVNPYFIKVLGQLQDGDWVVWDNCTTFKKSHINMFRKDNGNGTGLFLGQLQGSYTINEKSYSYDGILGALRPKIYIQSFKTIEILCDIPVYICSMDAKNKTKVVCTYGKGTYYIGQEANGMYNISLVAGNKDGWINPSENVAIIEPAVEPIIAPVEPPLPIEEEIPKEEPIVEVDEPIEVIEPNKWQSFIQAIIKLLNFIFKGER